MQHAVAATKDPFSSRFALLPSHLLRLIFRSILTRPRFLVLRLVCQRWKAAVESCPAKVAAERPSRFEELIYKLHLERGVPLSHVRLGGRAAAERNLERCVASRFSQVHSVQHLTLSDFATCCPLPALLSNSQTTLTHLELQVIPYGFDFDQAFGSFLADLHLPALRSFSVDCYQRRMSCECLVILLRNHSSQLTSLSMRHMQDLNYFSARLLSELSLPALQSLSVQQCRWADEPSLQPVLPQLTSLSLSWPSNNSAALWRSLASVLVGLACECTDEWQERIPLPDALLPLTRLRRLVLLETQEDEAPPAQLISQLQHWDASSSVLFCQALLPPIQSSTLRSLELSWAAKDLERTVPSTTHLPNLVKIIAQCNYSSLLWLAEALFTVKKHCPRLRIVRLCGIEEEHNKLRVLACALEAVGIEKLYLSRNLVQQWSACTKWLDVRIEPE